jgi:hypothetical protein
MLKGPGGGHLLKISSTPSPGLFELQTQASGEDFGRRSEHDTVQLRFGATLISGRPTVLLQIRDL